MARKKATKKAPAEYRVTTDGFVFDGTGGNILEKVRFPCRIFCLEIGFSARCKDADEAIEALRKIDKHPKCNLWRRDLIEQLFTRGRCLNAGEAMTPPRRSNAIDLICYGQVNLLI